MHHRSTALHLLKHPIRIKVRHGSTKTHWISTVSDQNIVWHASNVTRELREARNGHKAAVIWLTGLPSSGKSTTAHAVEQLLVAQGRQAYVLDGDNIRHGLSADLGFDTPARVEHLRRIGELAKLMYDAGMIVLCAFISPTRKSRRAVRDLLPAGTFLEVYCKCAVEVCERRDPKGFYARARAGTIADYTGISAPYEEPELPELVLDTATMPADRCASAVIELLGARGILNATMLRETTEKRD